MLTLVFNMDAICAFPIACRRQWRTPNTRVRTMHVEHQMENMFPPKAEMQYWGHCGIGNVLPKIVKLPNQGCARLIFSGGLDSDSYDNPGDSTPTQLKSQIC